MVVTHVRLLLAAKAAIKNLVIADHASIECSLNTLKVAYLETVDMVAKRRVGVCGTQQSFASDLRRAALLQPFPSSLQILVSTFYSIALRLLSRWRKISTASSYSSALRGISVN